MKHEWREVRYELADGRGQDHRDARLNGLLQPLEEDGWEVVAFAASGSTMIVTLKRPTAEAVAKTREASERSYPPGQAGVLVELNPQAQ